MLSRSGGVRTYTGADVRRAWAARGYLATLPPGDASRYRRRAFLRFGLRFWDELGAREYMARHGGRFYRISEAAWTLIAVPAATVHYLVHGSL